MSVARTLLMSAVGLALSAAPVLAQTLGQGAAPAISWWRIAAALILCLLLAVAAAFALHLRMTGRLPSIKGAKLTLPALRGTPLARMFNAPADRRLKAVETIRISPYADICLFVCDGRTYLVAATPQGVTVIERADKAPGEDAPP